MRETSSLRLHGVKIKQIFGLIIEQLEIKLSVCCAAKRYFYHTSFEENKNNPRGIKKLIKSLTCSDKGKNNINELKIGDSTTEDKGQIVDKFNIHFSTIADNLRSTLQ